MKLELALESDLESQKAFVSSGIAQSPTAAGIEPQWGYSQPDSVSPQIQAQPRRAAVNENVPAGRNNFLTAGLQAPNAAASPQPGTASTLQSRHRTLTGNSVSLRERQKLARQDQMIEAARTLFVANGYEKTTIEAVAETASVGVATVYTYFETKEGLAAAIIRKDNAEMFEEAEALLKNLPKSPADALVSMTSIFKDFNRFVSAELLRDFIIQAKGSGPISEALAWCHQGQIMLMDRALSQGQKAGTVSSTLDTQRAAELIADLLDRHVSRLTKSQDPGAVANQLTDFIHLLFQSWSGTQRRSSPGPRDPR